MQKKLRKFRLGLSKQVPALKLSDNAAIMHESLCDGVSDLARLSPPKLNEVMLSRRFCVWFRPWSSFESSAKFQSFICV